MSELSFQDACKVVGCGGYVMNFYGEVYGPKGRWFGKKGIWGKEFHRFDVFCAPYEKVRNPQK